MPNKLEELLKRIDESSEFHLELGLKMMKAGDANMFPVDFLALAALNRSANLTPAYVSLLRSHNLIAAAPLLRLQIDNCLRFYGVHLVEDCHEYANAVLKGEHVRRIKDSKGNLMTDRYLVQEISKEFKWIDKVYKKTSGYVHLSEVHISSIFGNTPKEKLDKGIVEIAIGPSDEIKNPVIYEEAAAAYIEATKTLFHYLTGWIKTKNAAQKKSKD